MEEFAFIKSLRGSIYGQVILVQHVTNQRLYAIKMLSLEYMHVHRAISGPKVKEDGLSELRILRTISDNRIQLQKPHKKVPSSSSSSSCCVPSFLPASSQRRNQIQPPPKSRRNQVYGTGHLDFGDETCSEHGKWAEIAQATRADLSLMEHRFVLMLYKDFIDFESNCRCLVFDFCPFGELYEYIQQQYHPHQLDDDEQDQHDEDQPLQEQEPEPTLQQQQQQQQQPQQMMIPSTSCDANHAKQTHSPVEIATARRFFKQIVQGLAFLHAKGIAHRDLSLENILLDRQLNCRIADFGLASDFGRVCVGRVGKCFYMAPEVYASGLSGQLYNGFVADIWSLGILLFILITGIPPIEVPNEMDARFRLIQKDGIGALLVMWQLENRVSHELRDLLSQLLCIVPDQRIPLDQILRHPWMELDLDLHANLHTGQAMDCGNVEQFQSFHIHAEEDEDANNQHQLTQKPVEAWQMKKHQMMATPPPSPQNQEEPMGMMEGMEPSDEQGWLSASTAAAQQQQQQQQQEQQQQQQQEQEQEQQQLCEAQWSNQQHDPAEETNQCRVRKKMRIVIGDTGSTAATSGSKRSQFVLPNGSTSFHCDDDDDSMHSHASDAVRHHCCLTTCANGCANATTNHMTGPNDGDPMTCSVLCHESPGASAIRQGIDPKRIVPTASPNMWPKVSIKAALRSLFGIQNQQQQQQQQQQHVKEKGCDSILEEAMDQDGPDFYQGPGQSFAQGPGPVDKEEATHGSATVLRCRACGQLASQESKLPFCDQCVCKLQQQQQQQMPEIA